MTSRKSLLFVVGIAIGLPLVLAVVTTIHHFFQIRSDIEDTFRSRSELLTRFIGVNRDRVTVMKNLISERYQAEGAQGGQAFEIRQHPAENVWSISAGTSGAAGTVTGKMPLPLSAEQAREIRAAFGMDAQIRAARQFDAEVVWLYYQSASQFIYLAPDVPFKDFHFTPELYTQRYWLEAQPARNPARRMVMAGPYQDMAGKGWIITFAAPVYAGERLMGIVGLDTRLETLQQLARVGDAPGHSMMVSENDRLIDSKAAYDPKARLHPPLSTTLIDWRSDQSGDLWLSSQIVEDELWLVHRVKRSEVYLAVARESLLQWLSLALLSLTLITAWRLRLSRDEVRRMTQIDPLTKVLNRRGFYDKVPALLALGQRKHFPVAFMLMDIDFFKKINDVHGHDVGDSVLRQLGAHLQQARRPFDLVCRWGGEEFVVLLMIDDAKEIAAVAERIRQEAQKARIDETGKTITLSAGLVVIQSGESVDAAIKRADLLLYEAKQSGRNRIVADLDDLVGTGDTGR
ncbi:diguanylate cyclase [Chitinimonas sp. BJYL2]|uniref:GGDEF domain-containing protein n=1 Tax=Chitinimonas sp. BJYL2 TaxID=2976696 RepID=UPI0022B40041|nr:sensor domain-containing diguanylate cyclase [Chitinimonas sp. BJYL2]